MSGGARGQALQLVAATLRQACLCAVAAGSALAEEPPPGAWLKRWVAEPPMAGNWLGARDALNGLGIKPSVRYWTDLMASVAGGQQRGQAYAGQLNVEIDTDLGKLAGLRRLPFHVSGNRAPVGTFLAKSGTPSRLPSGSKDESSGSPTCSCSNRSSTDASISRRGASRRATTSSPHPST